MKLSLQVQGFCLLMDIIEDMLKENGNGCNIDQYLVVI